MSDGYHTDSDPDPEEASSEESVQYVPSTPDASMGEPEPEPSAGRDGPVHTLETVVAALRRAELRISFLTNTVDAMGRRLDAVTARNEELEAQMQHPPGLGNQEISDRVDHLEHLLHSYSDNIDHDVAHLGVRMTVNELRVGVLEDDAQAAALAALIHPPPPPPAADGGAEDDAGSEVSDASDGPDDGPDPMEP